MKPKHYPDGDLEPLKIIQHYGLSFELGNALKYIARCNHKGTKREDLEKAADYLLRRDEYLSELIPDVEYFMEAWGISENLAEAVVSILFGDEFKARDNILKELSNE